MAVTVRLFASAREAFGSGTALLPAGRLPEMLADVAQRAQDPARLSAILAVCTVLHEGTRLRAIDDVTVRDGASLDVLPPVAGG